MPVGYPDWDRIKKPKAISALADLGELAARLWSIVTFDRRGDVIWLDGFEEGIQKWVDAVSGAGASVALSVDECRNGGYSCKLTGGSDEYRFARIVHSMPLPTVGNIGLEASFATNTDLDYIWLYITASEEPEMVSWGVRYSYTDLHFQYYDADGVWQNLGDELDLGYSDWPFHSAKLVVDMEAEEYVRAIMNDVEHDLSGIGTRVIDYEGAPGMAVQIRVNSPAGVNAVGYVDDVIVTQNEP